MISSTDTASPSRRLEAKESLLLQVAFWGVCLRGLDRLDTDALDDRDALAVEHLRDTLGEVLKALAGR